MKLQQRKRVKRKDYFEFERVSPEQRVAIKNAALSAQVLHHFISRKVPECPQLHKACSLLDEAVRQINSAICFYGTKTAL